MLVSRLYLCQYPRQSSTNVNMASATQISILESPVTTQQALLQTTPVNMEDAVNLAKGFRQALATLNTTPFDKFPDQHINEALHRLPSRLSTKAYQLAAAIASLLYPSTGYSAAALRNYETDRIRIRDHLERQRVKERPRPPIADGVVQAPVWSSRILAQGPWDPIKQPVSKQGIEALPMPVTVAEEKTLVPFFTHLENGGSYLASPGSGGQELDGGIGEPNYHTKGAEFERGVVYEDGRMDLCKMVVGPDHIGRLMQSLRSNQFIKHFLLGNNIIGPVGAREIAAFVEEFPNRIDTWYLAGNCIDSASFKTLVDSLVKSESVTNIWLKRNPLGPQSASDLFRLITKAKNLRTLDLNQTNLSDYGATSLFKQLAHYIPEDGASLSLRHIYLSGIGLGEDAAAAIADFLQSPYCKLESLYIGCNPIGDSGLKSLAVATASCHSLERIAIQSAGITSNGAISFFEAMKSHPTICMIDIGQSYITEDLDLAYNYIDDAAVPTIIDFINSKPPQLQYLRFSYCAITPERLMEVADAVRQRKILLFFTAVAIQGNSSASTEAIRQTLEENVRAKYGEDMTYTRFLGEEKRWIVSDKTDVRKIDSVYRNRDAGLARRGLKKLVKLWDDDDDTIARVMNAQGPFCTLRRRH